MAKWGPTKWEDAKILRIVTTRFESGLDRAGAFLTRQAKLLVSRDQPRVRLGGGRYRGLAPSRPGEPPKILTGLLRSSINWEVRRRGTAQLRLAFGVVNGPADEYAFRHEFGDVRVRRPFLRPTLVNHKREVALLMLPKGR